MFGKVETGSFIILGRRLPWDVGKWQGGVLTVISGEKKVRKHFAG
jgi:hypothetical protein